MIGQTLFLELCRARLLCRRAVKRQRERLGLGRRGGGGGGGGVEVASMAGSISGDKRQKGAGPS